MNEPCSSGFTLWLTGVPASGKSTLASKLADLFASLELPHQLLDGDVIRTNLSKGLGFSKEDRDTHVLRVGFICSLLNKHNVNTIVALISPYRDTRDKLKLSLPNFIEIYVDCPVEICIRRDPKGLYKKALSGEISEFTGISSPYEPPENPNLVIKTAEETIEQSVEKVLAYLCDKSLIKY